MTDFETPSAPEYGHVGALPTPDSLVDEQPEQPDPFAASMDKAASAMTGEQPAPPAEQQDTPQDVAPVEPDAPPQGQAPESTYKLRVAGEEREVTQSELLELASKGADYTRKTQELARERDRITALDALAQRLEADPGFRDHVFKYGQHPAQPQTQTADQPPTDPVERLKWEAVQQAKAEIMREIAPITEQIPEMQAMQRIEATKAVVRQDPAAKQVIEAMHVYVNAQPAPFRDRVFRELDTNPDAFLSVYEDFRGRLADIASRRSTVQSAPAAPQPQQQQKQPAPSPALESSGNVAPARSPDEASIRTLRKQIKDGTAGPDALGKMLKLSGAFSRMGV